MADEVLSQDIDIENYHCVEFLIVFDTITTIIKVISNAKRYFHKIGTYSG
jgi:hypothetical protein